MGSSVAGPQGGRGRVVAALYLLKCPVLPLTG